MGPYSFFFFLIKNSEWGLRGLIYLFIIFFFSQTYVMGAFFNWGIRQSSNPPSGRASLPNFN
jgi:hypothetical protein